MKLGSVFIHYGSSMYQQAEATCVSVGIPLDDAGATKERIEHAMYRLCGHWRTCTECRNEANPQFNLPATHQFLADGWSVIYKEKDHDHV